MLSRRSFLWLTGAAGLSTASLSAQRGRGGDALAGPVPPSIAALTSMRSLAKPIAADERRARLEKARRLMTEQKIDAIILAGGTSLNYFTGIRWGNSERLFAVVIPRVGNPYIVTPAFEEDRTREQLVAGPMEHTDISIYQEDESPFEKVAQGLKDRGIATGRIGVEETTKFVFADSVGGAAPALRVASATPITAGCRMIKDAHEIALMRLASQVTLKCYEAVFAALLTPQGKIMVDMGLIAQRDMLGALSDQLGLPLIAIEGAAPPDAPELEGLSHRFLRQCGAYPVSLVDNVLTVAMADPLDFETVGAIRAFSGLDIRTALAGDR
jgi:hypothetical protein